MPRPTACILVLFVGACGPNTGGTPGDASTGAATTGPANPASTSPTTGPDDTSSEPTTTTGTTTTGTTGDPALVDCAADPPQFPAYHDAACINDSHCAIGFHQVDCCGTRVATGIAAADVAAFTADEATCAAQFPACECAAKPTLADSGQTAPDQAGFAVACVASTCLSFVP